MNQMNGWKSKMKADNGLCEVCSSWACSRNVRCGIQVLQGGEWFDMCAPNMCSVMTLRA
jgi:hypothetical protein